MRNIYLSLTFIFIAGFTFAQDNFPDLLSERNRSQVIDEILEERLDISWPIEQVRAFDPMLRHLVLRQQP